MLNIFRKIKDYDAVANQLRKVTTINVRKSEMLSTANEKIEKLQQENAALVDEIKLLKFSKGGYKSTITKLKNEVDELNKKLAESMTDKYLLKKIPSGRLPKGEPMKIRGSAKTSAIAKNLKTEE